MQALILLAKLPMRNPTDLALVKAVYFIALEGVTAFGLEQATKAIIRGSLGHAFMPSPPELRRECERIMDSERDKLVNARRLEWPEDLNSTAPPDDAARQRMTERWLAVRPMFEPPKPAEPARPKTDDERMADLLAHANDPIETTPTLIKTLKAKQWMEDHP
jgi:hypothetical protein